MSEVRPRLIFLNRVYWPSQAATAQLLTDLAEGLAARGWQVHIITAGRESGVRHGVHVHRTGSPEGHGGLFSRLVNYGRFRRRAQHLLNTLAQPGDIVVPMTDPPLLGTAVAGIARLRGARVVHWIQDIYPEILSAHVGAFASLLLGPLRARRNAAWRTSAGCAVLGDDMAQAVAEHGVSAERLSVVPNWAPRELQTPAAPPDVAAKRAAWGLADKFIVAYSGNLGRVHEFAAILAAAERLRDRREIVFLFIGAGARFAEVRSAAQARGLANLRFLPPEPREQLASALAAADAHLVTLRPEFARLVYPSKLAGVLAAGRPVLFVGPPAGEIARLLAREQCGVALAPTEGTRLAETVRRWQTEPDHCARLGRRSRTVYEQQFTFAGALDRWEKILRQVAATPG